jgi:uncharacterized protein
LKEINLKKNIESLILLQIIDKKLYDIEMLRGDLPKQVELLKSEINELEEDIRVDQTSIKDFKTEESALDGEQDVNKAKIRKYNEQLLKVTSNKEYEATSAQIDYCEQEIKRIQNRISEIGYKQLELEEALKPKQERLQSIHDDFKQRDAELKVKTEVTSKEEQELLKQRETIIPNIRKDILNKYERIRKAKQGIAVVPINKLSCGGCFNQVPAQIIIELRKKDMIRTCEYCGRILFVNDVLEVQTGAVS